MDECSKQHEMLPRMADGIWARLHVQCAQHCNARIHDINGDCAIALEYMAKHWDCICIRCMQRLGAIHEAVWPKQRSCGMPATCVMCNDASTLANSDADAVCAINASTARNEFRMRVNTESEIITCEAVKI